MNIDKIDKYFADRGTKVVYNCLGHTENLVRSYVKKFHAIVENGYRKESQHVKHSCYSTMYELKPRNKFTGFEKFRTIDKNFRKQISALITEAQVSPTLVVDNVDNDVSDDYKSELKSFVSTIDNPILYLSGGIDSELVANAMIDKGVKFIPVIINYVNNANQSFNLFDVNYAYKFCAKYNLYPITKTINIEELWNSTEFAKLAIDLQIQSTHLVTHAYIIELMKNDFPDHTHVFGGEVRFYTYHQLDDGRMANLVLLAKIAPGYNGSQYTATSFTGGTPASLYLDYNSDGTWTISGTGNQSVDTDSGTWTTTPGSSYEFRVSAISSITLTGIGQLSPDSLGVPTAWSDITASTFVVEAVADPFTVSNAWATWTIQVRTKTGAQTGIIQSSTVRFETTYEA